MRSLIGFLTFAGVCCAQTSPAPSPLIGHTGIEGRVIIAPIHPGPERPGVVNSKPLANTTFVITSEGGSSIEFTTDDQGQFKLSLTPGHYSVTKKGQEKIGRCGPFEAFVVAGQLNHVEWRCDSGMR